MAIFNGFEGTIKVMLAKGGTVTIGLSRSGSEASNFDELANVIAQAFRDATEKLHEGPHAEKVKALEVEVAKLKARLTMPTLPVAPVPVSRRRKE